ncbi:MAG: hypothetical protein NE330_23010 [Lentisphaeraceae bacterium]|nr:hypothetical protein [Lentisphaeraceae bacterium]
MTLKLIFSDYFEVDEETLNDYGALDICLDADLPLFIDPFLLFASEKEEYKTLHKKIVSHLVSLKEIALENGLESDKNLFQFKEIKQNWLGLCKYGNQGKGLGPKFAKNIISAFNGFYSDFGKEDITDESHIEKLTLIGSGVGKDFISDFTTNLMYEYLLDFTENFAKNHLKPHQIKKFNIRCRFDEKLKIWTPKEFELPYFYLEEKGDFILLTPLDILTKDESFINHNELLNKFDSITSSIGDQSLKNAINSYFRQVLPKKNTKSDKHKAIVKTIDQYPEILDYYIKGKENQKEVSTKLSKEKIDQLREELISTLSLLCEQVYEHSDFFKIKPNSYREALQRAIFLKEVIEDNDGYRVFYKDGKPIALEDTIQRIFRLTWYASPYDVNAEVNNGRGPADYKVSFGSGDSTIVEFKLAKSTSLKPNLQHQTEIYKKASKSISDIKVILCYTFADITKVNKILKELNLQDAENIIIIDARRKTSASKVK